jgi:hypothetical protein
MHTKQGYVGIGVSIAMLIGLAVVPAFAQTDDYGIGTTSGTYCPQLFQTVVRGSSGNQVLELQKFLSDYYDIFPSTIQTGYFGRITQGYVIQFQKEQGLPSYGIAGSMTRAAIAKVCTTKPPVVRSCPQYQMPICATGQHVQRGATDVNGCQGAPMCVNDTVIQSCPVYNACPSGYSTNTSTDSNGCTKISCTPVSRPSSSITASPTAGTAPLLVTFAVPDTCVQGLASENVRRIDFGDGKTESVSACVAQSVTHTYQSAGSYIASLQSAGYGPAPLTWATQSSITVTVSGQIISTPTIRVVSPNGGETYTAGSATRVQWDASNIPATTYAGSSQVSYKIGLTVINSSGNAVGYISSGGEGYDRDLFDGTARITQWDPASLSGGFSPLNQLKVRAAVIKRTNQCVSAAAAYSSLATSPIACISEETVASDDSDSWFSVKGATVCDNTVSPMVCTQS